VHEAFAWLFLEVYTQEPKHGDVNQREKMRGGDVGSGAKKGRQTCRHTNRQKRSGAYTAIHELNTGHI
jgi:hypothetical protein